LTAVKVAALHDEVKSAEQAAKEIQADVEATMQLTM